MKKEIKILNFDIDARAAMPVYEQVKQEIKLRVISGHLAAGDKLPPIRELAARLKINPNTIVKVYYQLDVEGFIYSQPGTGYFVRADREEDRDAKKGLFEQITEDFISKALKLGFSLEEMAQKLKERADEAGKKTNSKQNGEQNDS
ncbi:MAG: GntR family transcriptional regulator [bacterium]|nr:GntR family transcriptional regulator [bacterium]